MKTPPEKSSALKRFVRGTVFATAALITFTALLYAEEDWRGSHAWSNYKSRMEAKGESFDPARLIPPKVADGQNLAMIPFFTKFENIQLPWGNLVFPHRPTSSPTWKCGLAVDLTNWAEAYGSPAADPVQAASNVLAAMNHQEPLLNELSTEKDRPSCRFDIDYMNWPDNTNVQGAMIHQLTQIKMFFQVMSLRAQAELVAGQSNKALGDVELMFRVNDGVRDEPLFISQLVAYASLEILLRPAIEGMAEHRWSDAQLRTLQERLQRTDLLASTLRSFDGERDLCYYPGINGMDVSAIPRGWNRMEQLNLARAIQDTFMPRINVAARQIDPGISRICDVAVTNLSRYARFHHRFVAAATMPAFEHACIHTAQTQTDINEARVACALERFRLAEGHYPETLDALVPRFATALPRDIINGQPLKYRRTDDGQFILYSVGWNQTDDGGTIATNKGGNPDRMRGDWVFKYPSVQEVKDEAENLRSKGA